MVADNATIQTPELTTEERKLLAEKLDGLDAITLEDAIAHAPRRKKDARGRTWRFGEGAGKVVRQLFKLWEGKGEADDGSVHKCKREMMAETRLTERKLRSAVAVLVEEGLLETWNGYRNDRRETTFYLLNLWECFKVASASEMTTVEERLEHERRGKYRARLERKLSDLRATLDDLELRFAEPVEHDEYCDLPDPEDCVECGEVWDAHEVWCSLANEPEPDDHDEDAPPLTDHDAPEESAPVDWLPHDTLSTAPPQSVPLPPATCGGSPDKLSPLHENTQRDDNKRLTGESSFATQTLPSYRRLSAPPDVGEGFKESVSTTSTPSPDDSSGSNGTDQETSTPPPETTRPMPAREAWAMYERGEATLLEVEEMCRPTNAKKEVA